MKTQTLSISATNLTTKENFDFAIFASNPFMLLNKLNSILDRNTWINGWTLVNNKWEAGNNGMNAEAYLWEMMEELN